ncbi:MAG: hypothetical protein U9N31_05355, partial [Candidatus Marinimicrobia bacterium]|nr:hypothetical protein [Candidatus Neomarinimicrobiota bacterium]
PKGEEPYANNMETIIHADIILLDVETGQTLNTFPIGAMHTGGSRGKSLSKALSIIRMNVSRSLRELYTITSEVLDVQGSEVTMYLGSDLGVKRGIVYEISRLDKKKKLRDRDVTIPGRSVGLVRIDRVSDDASMGTIVRKWGRVKEGYKATEMINPPQGGFGFYFTYNNEREAIDRGGIAFQIKPFSRWGGHFHFGGGSMIDSRGDRDAMFSFGGGFIYRFLYTPKFNLSAVVDFPLDFVSRNDDYDHNVSTLLFAPQIGLQTEVMINRKVDLIVRAGYSRAKANGKWTYNEGEGDDTKSIDAKWDERGEPTLDAAGMYVNISLRFLAID